MIQIDPWIARRSIASLLVVAAVTAIVCGCKSPLPRSWQTEDIEPQRELRKQDAISNFEAQRNDVECAAAADRLKTGDVKGCRKQLDAILARNPQHTEARQLLAQVGQMEQRDNQPVATAQWDPSDADLADSEIAIASAQMPTVAPSAAQARFRSKPRASDEDGDVSTYAASSDQSEASFCLGPAGAAQGGRRLPVYRTNLSQYKGGARGELARRSIRQAVECLAVSDAAQARLYYRAAAAAEPDNADLLVAAAAMALRYDQDALASELAQSAISAQPSQPAAYRTLATICYRQGDYQGSYEALSRAISLDKAHPLSYFLMGSTLRKLGENDKADWHFQQAASLDQSYAARR